VKKAPPGFSPPPYENADIHAFQALARGEAKPEEQRRAINWLIKAANTYEVSFHPESERLSAFAEGRRFVGLQIVKLLNLNLSKLQKD
jgi:hypothetical protein